MKRYLFFAFRNVIGVCFLFSATQVIAQQITPKVIPVRKPEIVNFKALADYLLLHPEKRKPCIVEQGEDRFEDYAFKPAHIPSNAPVFNTSTGQERSVNSNSPSPRSVFNGITGDTIIAPPDINGAVGTTYILETTNQEFDIFTKQGVKIARLDAPTLFEQYNGYDYFDPHVEYDAAHSRYIIICAGWYFSNYDMAGFIAVSETSDPTGNWYTYSFDASDTLPSGYSFFDYPLLGYNENWVVVTGNFFNFNLNTVYSDIYVFNRADLYSGTLGTAKEFSDTDGVTLTPTQTYDATQATEYFVQDANGNKNGNGYIRIGSLTGSVNAPVFSAGSSIGVNSAWGDTGTIGASQEGGFPNIESGLDTRIENAVYRNGSLWFTHTVYLPAASPTYCAVDWWQVNPAALTVTQFNRIEDPDGVIDYYYPSIGVDVNNDVLVGYCTSSPNTYASAQYSYHAYTDAKNTMETGYLFKTGLAPYYYTEGGPRNRYGDFTFTTTDPANNSFWTFQEYADTPATITWGTVMANVPNSASAINTLPADNGSIQVYPNPTSGAFDIAMHNLPAGNYTLSLYNILGQKMMEKQTPVSASYYTISIDISKLPAGMYFIRVIAGNSEWAQRITKR